jgi:hypothetical protein
MQHEQYHGIYCFARLKNRNPKMGSAWESNTSKLLPFSGQRISRPAQALAACFPLAHLAGMLWQNDDYDMFIPFLGPSAPTAALAC